MAEFLSSDPAVQDAHPHTTYDLLANICHDGPAGKSAIVVVAIKACVLHSDIQVLIATSHYWPQAYIYSINSLTIKPNCHTKCTFE